MAIMDIHFEDIWNAAEHVAYQFPEEQIETKVKKIKSRLDKLPAMVTFPSKQAEIIGDILFDLCAITQKLNINSAAALRLSIETRKADLLDPDDNAVEQDNASQSTTLHSSDS